MVAHLDEVTCLAVDPTGLFLLSGSKYLLHIKLEELHCPENSIQHSCNLFILAFHRITSDLSFFLSDRFFLRRVSC